jgi:DNA topoisomerase I
MITEELTRNELRDIGTDVEKAAELASLVYTTDTMKGIQRVRKGKNFTYLLSDKEVNDEKQLARIRKLAIPPAWEEVWICKLHNGHLQATGKDSKNRKQYRYHEQWNELRNQTKFHRLLEFGKQLPALRLKLEEDISLPGLNEDKVIATVISLMERTYIRIGNQEYEKMNGSYGLSTLKDKHVKIEGHTIRFSFTGKKGISHDISLKNRKLASIVKACQEIPGRELFQYYDDDGNKKAIDSGKVNTYIKNITGGDFTTKDFRTWAGTLQIIRSLNSMEEAISIAEKKKKVIAALDEVSVKLGNTRTVCKNYYVHPGIIRLYEEDKLNDYIEQLDDIEKPDQISGLTNEEKVLMKILKKI